VKQKNRCFTIKYFKLRHEIEVKLSTSATAYTEKRFVSILLLRSHPVDSVGSTSSSAQHQHQRRRIARRTNLTKSSHHDTNRWSPSLTGASIGHTWDPGMGRPGLGSQLPHACLMSRAYNTHSGDSMPRKHQSPTA
jgi:hypothetical protein